MYTNSFGQSGSFSFYNYQNKNVPKSNLILNNINVNKLSNFNNLQDITFMKIDVEKL